MPPSVSYDVENLMRQGTTSDRTGKKKQRTKGTVPQVSAHLESISVPPYWRQRTKHPSAQHSLQYSGHEPRLCYSPRIPSRRKPKRGAGGQGADKNPNAKHRSLKPSKRTKIPAYLDLTDGELDEDELLIADILEGKPNARHIAMEDVSTLLAQRSAKKHKENSRKATPSFAEPCTSGASSAQACY